MINSVIENIFRSVTRQPTDGLAPITGPKKQGINHYREVTLQAQDKVYSRLRSINAALNDLNIANRQEFATMRDLQPKYLEVSRNRAATLLLAIYHLKDDVRGLARALGRSGKIVDTFCSQTTFITTCIDAGDTFKHGVGGHSKNYTVISHFAVVSHKPEGSDKSTILAIIPIVVDREGKPHQADQLARAAMREWIPFLRDNLQLDTSSYENDWQEPQGNGVWEYELPQEFTEQTKKYIDHLNRTS